jgi:hypothetical protein
MPEPPVAAPAPRPNRGRRILAASFLMFWPYPLLLLLRPSLRRDRFLLPHAREATRYLLALIAGIAIVVLLALAVEPWLGGLVYLPAGGCVAVALVVASPASALLLARATAGRPPVVVGWRWAALREQADVDDARRAAVLALISPSDLALLVAPLVMSRWFPRPEVCRVRWVPLTAAGGWSISILGAFAVGTLLPAAGYVVGVAGVAATAWWYIGRVRAELRPLPPVAAV